MKIVPANNTANVHTFAYTSGTVTSFRRTKSTFRKRENLNFPFNRATQRKRQVYNLKRCDAGGTVPVWGCGDGKAQRGRRVAVVTILSFLTSLVALLTPGSHVHFNFVHPTHYLLPLPSLPLKRSGPFRPTISYEFIPPINLHYLCLRSISTGSARQQNKKTKQKIVYKNSSSLEPLYTKESRHVENEEGVHGG